MTLVPLITVVEADVYNTGIDWLQQTTEEKEVRVYNASLYMVGRWNCVDVDWEDVATLTSEQKRACAYYAEADRIGILYPAVAETDKVGRMVEHSEEIDGLKETTKWSPTGSSVNGNPLKSIDELMYLNCVRSGIGSNTLVRV